MTRRSTLVLSAIVLLAMAVRIPGIFTEFWGDEIWSWSIAGQLHSIPGILLATPAQIDNNHPLNTLWLYLCGPNAAVWWYRFPSFLAGIASVLVAVHIMWRRSPRAAIAAAVLIGFSYPLVFYSSEARGYAPAVFFGLLAFDAMEFALATRNRAAELVFGMAASLGFLSHLTFLHVYLAAFVWSVVEYRETEKPRKTRRREGRHEEEKDESNSSICFVSSFFPSRSTWLFRLVRFHALPVATACLLYTLFVKHMVIGGAVPTNPASVILQTLALAIGGPSHGIGCAIAAGIAVAVFIFSLLLNREETWVFFIVAVFASPALTTVRELAFYDHPQPLMLRYFLVCETFLLLALCPAIGRLWERSTAMRVLLTIGSIGYLIGNSCQLRTFWQLGRGHTADALAHIAAVQPDGDIELTSTNLPRTQMLLSFHVPRMVPVREVHLHGHAAQWLVVNRNEPSGAATLTFDRADYRLESVYRAGELSGWSWMVYRRVDE